MSRCIKRKLDRLKAMTIESWKPPPIVKSTGNAGITVLSKRKPTCFSCEMNFCKSGIPFKRLNVK